MLPYFFVSEYLLFYSFNKEFIIFSAYLVSILVKIFCEGRQGGQKETASNRPNELM